MPHWTVTINARKQSINNGDCVEISLKYTQVGLQRTRARVHAATHLYTWLIMSSSTISTVSGGPLGVRGLTDMGCTLYEPRLDAQLGLRYLSPRPPLLRPADVGDLPGGTTYAAAVLDSPAVVMTIGAVCVLLVIALEQ